MSVTYFKPGRPIAEESLPTVSEHLRQLARILNNTVAGQDNSSLAITLDGTVTTITDPRISAQTCLHLMPTSAAAAAALTSLWITCTKQQAVITGGSAGLTYTASIAG
jgi:hypothetical protein